MKPWLKKQWIIPEANADFVYYMEDVLDIYTLPYDPKKPVICMDELSKQLIKDTKTPLGMKIGQIEKYDYHYERNGTRNIFIFFEPLIGKRYTDRTDRRTKIDWAKAMKKLEKKYSDSEKIIMIMDNLNTHKPSSFYDAFEAAEAKRLIKRFEFHYTPKHASWLNMAELELSVLSRQCLNRRIPDKDKLNIEVSAWENERNNKEMKVNWQFTTEDARIKLKKLYPSIEG